MASNDEDLDTSKSLDEILTEADDKEKNKTTEEDKDMEPTLAEMSEKAKIESKTQSPIEVSKTNDSPSSKKKWLIAATLIVLAIIGIVAYSLLSTVDQVDNATPTVDQDEAETVETDTPPTPRVSFVDATSLKGINDNQEINTVVDLSSDQFIIDTRGNESAVATFQEELISKVSIYTGSELEYEFEISENQPSYYYNVIFDFDSKQLVAMLYDTSDGLDIHVASYSNESTDGEIEYSYSIPQDKPPLVPIHVYKNTILAQRYSCFECDGPIQAELWEIDMSTNSAKSVYVAPGASVLNADKAEVSPDKTNVYFVATDVFLGAGGPDTADELKNAEYKVFEYDVANKKGTEVYAEQGSKIAVAGFSENPNEIFITRAAVEEDTESVLFGIPTLSRLNTASSSVRDLTLSLSKLQSTSNLENVLLVNEQLYFRIRNYENDNTVRYNYALDLSEDSDGMVELLSTLSAQASAVQQYDTFFVNRLY